MQYHGIGTVVGYSTVGSQSVQISLKDVLYAPDAHSHFISESKLDNLGFTITRSRGTCRISHAGRTYGLAKQADGTYWLSLEPQHTLQAAQVLPSADLWHRRFGHISHSAMRHFNGDQTRVTGFQFDPATKPASPCEGRELGKQHHSPHPLSDKRATSLLELVHSDLMGPLQVQAFRTSHVYIATFLDDCSSFAALYYLTTKDQLRDALKQYVEWAERQTGKKLKALRSDRGGEYINHTLSEYLITKGIEHHFSMPGTPQQNGRAE